ncbi:hypothetical protein OFM21_29425, partial [Escherichia coli]|nr:hypothetical protein [Escherichia coli]
MVASRTGGLPELVVEGHCGFLRPIGDVAGMTEATLEILNNAYRRRQMGEAARDRAIQSFRPEVILPKYLEVYERTLEGTRA